MRKVGKMANICYFNYATTGEQVGRAMMGFEFDDEASRRRFIDYLNDRGPTHQELSEDVLRAVL